MSKTTQFPEKGYPVGPHSVDSAPIAWSLLKVAIGFASANNPAGCITLAINIASDFNLEGVSILEEEIGAKLMLFECHIHV